MNIKKNHEDDDTMLDLEIPPLIIKPAVSKLLQDSLTFLGKPSALPHEN